MTVEAVLIVLGFAALAAPAYIFGREHGRSRSDEVWREDWVAEKRQREQAERSTEEAVNRLKVSLYYGRAGEFDLGSVEALARALCRAEGVDPDMTMQQFYGVYGHLRGGSNLIWTEYTQTALRVIKGLRGETYRAT